MRAPVAVTFTALDEIPLPSGSSPHEGRFDHLTAERVKKALRFSTAEGTAYGAFLGFGDHYVVAFAVALQASSFLIGILCSLPGLLAALAQLWDTQLVKLLGGRRRVVLAFSMAQALMFLPLLALAFVHVGSKGWLLVLFASLYSVCGAMVSPAWGSIMAEVVPENLRGRYFSLRGRFSTAATICAFLLAGLVLALMVNGALWGFAILFGAAVVSRLVSWGFLTRLYERDAAPASAAAPAKGFVRTLPSTNLGRYMLFLFAMSFAVNIASPYFTLYELRDLKFSYLTFAVLETVSSAATIFALTRWGRAADRAGNFKMLALASALIPLVPLLWMFSANRAYLGAIQAFSGFAWAGFNLCTVNYLYDATEPGSRTRYLAYFNAGNGLATGAGALLGGYLVPHLPAVLGYQTLALFLISGLARGAVTVAFLPQIREVRRVSRLSAAELFHMLTGGRPVTRRISHRRSIHVHHHEPG